MCTKHGERWRRGNNLPAMKKAFEGNTEQIVAEIEKWLVKNSPIKDKFDPEKEDMWKDYQVVVEIL